jgi:hypothetical protein
MTNDQRPSPLAVRLGRFQTESPRAGEAFPELMVALLEGGSWSPSASAGRAFVLQTGSFT